VQEPGSGISRLRFAKPSATAAVQSVKVGLFPSRHAEACVNADRFYQSWKWIVNQAHRLQKTPAIRDGRRV
jgi:hypothetical protein